MGLPSVPLGQAACVVVDPAGLAAGQGGVGGQLQGWHRRAEGSAPPGGKEDQVGNYSPQHTSRFPDRHGPHSKYYWSRFNIMFGINVSLFGLETVLFNSVCQTSEYLTFIIAFGGLSFSIWSIYVMQRLWSYHEHWKNMLCEAEKAFPDEYVKLFTKIPSNLKREKKSWELWLKSYTQPFFAILSLIWLLIMVHFTAQITGKRTIKCPHDHCHQCRSNTDHE